MQIHKSRDADGQGLLDLLRRKTAEDHRAIEQHPLLIPLLSATLTMAQYQRVLLCFFAFYRQLEQKLVPALQKLDDPNYSYRPRTPLLQQDLLALGQSIPASVIEEPARLELSTRAQLLGTLYVLEGSTQGGRLIGPAVCRQLALTPDSGSRFFHLFRLDQWPQCKALLQQQAGHADSITSAREIFLMLHRYLDAYLIRKD